MISIYTVHMLYLFYMKIKCYNKIKKQFTEKKKSLQKAIWQIDQSSSSPQQQQQRKAAILYWNNSKKKVSKSQSMLYFDSWIAIFDDFLWFIYILFWQSSSCFVCIQKK